MILRTTEQYFRDQPFLNMLYQALFATSYFGLFRVGELTLGEHTVKARDVQIGKNKNKMLFILRTSKTHWKDAKPQMIKIMSKEAGVGANKNTK